MVRKKYKLLKNDAIKVANKTLYRIKALRSFNTINNMYVNAGDLGGYVESEDNLSQEDNCWIFDNSIVMDRCTVSDGSVVLNNSKLVYDTHLLDCSKVDNSTLVSKLNIRSSTISDSSVSISYGEIYDCCLSETTIDAYNLIMNLCYLVRSDLKSSSYHMYLNNANTADAVIGSQFDIIVLSLADKDGNEASISIYRDKDDVLHLTSDRLPISKMSINMYFNKDAADLINAAVKVIENRRR